MLDYQAMAALAAVIREGGFDRAALALGVTPSAISQRVRALEERVGAVLVVRSQPCRPTAIGARLCAHVEQVRLLEGDVLSALPGLAQGGALDARTLPVAVNADSLATWFPAAASDFALQSGALLDLVIDDEGYTAERLRNGEVLAAVTADPTPVTGCQRFNLGAVPYVATAAPAFVARHFARGLDAAALQQAPMLRFDRRDRLQARWVLKATGGEVAPPTHWIPSTQGMLDMTLAGLGWGMAPLSLCAPHLAAGRLVDLAPGQRIEVRLYWQRTRLAASLLDQLTQIVRLSARDCLAAMPAGDP